MTSGRRNRGNINSVLLGSLSLFCATAVLPQTARAGQGPTPDLPGVSKGKVEAYWIGPNVRVSKARIGERGATTVTWFNEDGTIKRQADVSSAEPGFVITITRRLPEALTRTRFAPDFVQRSAYRNVVQGVNKDWRIVLPNKTGPAGYITSTPDSRVFVHEFHPKQGQVALDIYAHGKRANTVGPFPQYGGEDVHLSDDGSAALLVWKDESKKTAQLVVLNPGGKVSFRVDCDLPVHSPIAAPRGTGALLRPNTGGTNQNTFLWYTREGKLRSQDISPNPYCIGWVPEIHKALFSTSGFDYRYRLIDWNAAKTLWDIPCPGDNGHALAISLTPRLVIFAVGELHQSGWIRAFYAVSVEDGSLVARWQAPYLRRISTEDRESFLWLGDRLFFITSDEVVEFSEEEIISKKNGWK